MPPAVMPAAAPGLRPALSLLLFSLPQKKGFETRGCAHTKLGGERKLLSIGAAAIEACMPRSTAGGSALRCVRLHAKAYCHVPPGVVALHVTAALQGERKPVAACGVASVLEARVRRIQQWRLGAESKRRETELLDQHCCKRAVTTSGAVEPASFAHGMQPSLGGDQKSWGHALLKEGTHCRGCEAASVSSCT
jgi:hypothetical protein